MSPLLATVFFGLMASASWGIGDFTGGMASKRLGAISVVAVSHLTGLLLLPLIALLLHEPLPAPRDVLVGAVAGLCGTTGLVALYRALSSGRMGIAAPVSSVVSAALPLLFSLTLGDVPGVFQAIGFVCGLASVWLVGQEAGATREHSGLGMAIIAGIGFSGFLIGLDQIESTAIFWPLTAARTTSTIMIVAIVLLSRRSLRADTPITLLAMLTSGVLDVVADVAFILATRNGELGVASVLSALYPAVTILLAWTFLREHITRWQGVGISLALVAVALISIG